MVERRNIREFVAALVVGCLLVACGPSLPAPPSETGPSTAEVETYVIGPLDTLEIFVWQVEEVSRTVPVRPDGRISLPLVDGDIVAAGRTPTALAAAIKQAIAPFVQEPIVTVIVAGFGDASGQTVRVVGEAARPTAVPYRAGMTVLDVMVAVGGLGQYAAGNRSVLMRGRGEGEKVYGLRLDDLLRSGDISADAPVLPGDVVLIPQSLL